MKKLIVCSLIFLLNTLLCFSQDSEVFSFEILLQKIEDEKLTQKEKIFWCDIYYKKALEKKDLKQQYTALLNKYFLTDNEQEVNDITDKMLAVSTGLKDKKLLAETYERRALKNYKLKNFYKALKDALIAEEYYKSIHNEFGLYSVKVFIGNIYFHTKQYNRAKQYYREAVFFFRSNKRDYNYYSGYISSLYSLSKTCSLLREIDTVDMLTLEAQNAIRYLDKNDQLMEQAYIDYVKGTNLFLKKKYSESEYFLKKALPEICRNKDINNEHIIYLYLGKNALASNQKEKAIKYFNRIDSLFQEKAYLSYELREAYDYLIAYYKENKQPQEQLAATENLIELNKLFEKQQQQLTNTLFYDNENKKLEISKRMLQNQLSEKSVQFRHIFLGCSAIIIFLVMLGLWQNAQQKKLRLRFLELRQRIEAEDKPKPFIILDNTDKISRINKSAETFSIQKDDTTLGTEQRIIDALKKFELQKEYLKPVNLNSLALNLNTNRNTLSKVINTYKQSNFNYYINSLRIEQMLKDLSNKPQLRKLNMNGLADEYGFKNTKTFSTYFKQYTGLTPAYFIEQLECDDANVNTV